MKQTLVFAVAALVGATGVARATVACDAFRAFAFWVGSAKADGAALPLPADTGGFVFRASDNAREAHAELDGFDPATGGHRTIRLRRLP